MFADNMGTQSDLRYKVFLLLGSNQGQKEEMLRQARILLSIHTGIILNASSIYDTSPWGEEDQDTFINQAIEIQTELNPSALLTVLQKIEIRLGKAKTSKWGPRTIDIDILLYDNLIISEDKLSIPHPRMLGRKFVLIPLSEIAGELLHPIAKRRISDLVDVCEDHGTVSKRVNLEE